MDFLAKQHVANSNVKIVDISGSESREGGDSFLLLDQVNYLFCNPNVPLGKS